MWLTVVGFLLLLSRVAHALYNVTVDDDHTSIVYGGIWEARNEHSSDLHYGGSLSLSESPSSFASFAFTGVAIYYLSPKWPSTANLFISLDSQPAVRVDLTDFSRPADVDGTMKGKRNAAASAPSSILWSATGLINGLHQVLITSGDNLNVVDGFIYTALGKRDVPTTVDPSSFNSIVGDSFPSPSSSVTDQTDTSSAAMDSFGIPANEIRSKPSSLRILMAVIGTTVPFSIISTLSITIFLRRRRRRMKKKKPFTPLDAPPIIREYVVDSKHSSASKLTGKLMAAELYGINHYDKNQTLREHKQLNEFKSYKDIKGKGSDGPKDLKIFRLPKEVDEKKANKGGSGLKSLFLQPSLGQEQTQGKQWKKEQKRLEVEEKERTREWAREQDRKRDRELLELSLGLALGLRREANSPSYNIQSYQNCSTYPSPPARTLTPPATPPPPSPPPIPVLAVPQQAAQPPPRPPKSDKRAWSVWPDYSDEKLDELHEPARFDKFDKVEKSPRSDRFDDRAIRPSKQRGRSDSLSDILRQLEPARPRK